MQQWMISIIGYRRLRMTGNKKWRPQSPFFIINSNSFLLFLDFYLAVVKTLYYGK